MKRFYLNIIFPSILSILLFVLAMFFFVIPHFQQNIMNGKREMIKELINSACSILAKYENDERNGLISREEAQNTAISRIQYLRYGEDNKDYFWITDMHPNMVMHPYRPELNGTDLTDLTDPHGKKLFVEFVRTVEKSGHGYVDYMWQWKDDSLHIVPKLSYVSLFEPWGWVIGTGIYIEDVKKEIRALTKKILWISIGISSSIAFLLLIISRNSLKIEMKRLYAENELQESKEKYKTLVEAATEGLIMLIDGKISFSNNVITQMTGYENTELIDRSFNELISGNNNNYVIETFSGNVVREGQFETNLKIKNGGFIEVLITSSKGDFFNKKVNIIIVKDLTVEKDINLSSIDYQRLIGLLDVGFFRARMESKGSFLFASETTVSILGYDNFNELSEMHILEMLTDTDDKKNFRKILVDNGYLKNKILKIIKKNHEPAIVKVTLVVSKTDIHDELVCDGIIMDITKQEKEKEESRQLIAELKSFTFFIEQPLKNYLAPVHEMDANSTIAHVLKELTIRKTDNLLLTKDEKDHIGIITNSDIRNRVLSFDLQLDNPAYLIMSSPLITAKESVSIIDAILLCEENKINHLVVKNEPGNISGIFRMNDILKEFRNSLLFFIEKVGKAETDDELKNHYSQLQIYIKSLIKSGLSVKYITNITSSFSDAVIRKVIDIIISKIGPPPVGFSFICMGSEGRKEETLLTDQDNAIIYDDVPVEEADPVNDYFQKLGYLVCQSLDYIGYSFCKGNIMAKNPEWCKPLKNWEKYFTEWITNPEPQNLLDASIFFDFRNVYGDEKLPGRLRTTINALSKRNPLFLYHMASNTCNVKSQSLSSGNFLPDKTADMVDLKNAVSIIVMFARTYSLKADIQHTNTVDRLNSLKEKEVVSADTIDEIVFAWEYLMKLRFRKQLELSDSNLPLSNTLNVKSLIEMEGALLKKVLSQLSVFQSRISIDFRISP